MTDARDTVERWYAALDRDDEDGMLSVTAPDAVWRYPGGPSLGYAGQWDGHDAIRRFFAAHDAAEEVLGFEIDRMLADGDRVDVHGRFEGRARATGQAWSTRFVHAIEVRDGSITRFEAFFDTQAAEAARRTA